MSIEAGVLVANDGTPIYWHTPKNRNSAALPDSRELWDVMWEHRNNILGFAHSHPGSGVPGPSHEDVTTFAAVEAALGRKIYWWITSSDTLAKMLWCGPGKHGYVALEVDHEPIWLAQLRDLSK